MVLIIMGCSFNTAFDPCSPYEMLFYTLIPIQTDKKFLTIGIKS